MWGRRQVPQSPHRFNVSVSFKTSVINLEFLVFSYYFQLSQDL
jgi:hypothetical protein